LLFAATGCACLIYEIVWLQMLQLVIGSSAMSLGILLGTFMGGMCLGSLALPRFIGGRHPLRVYAFLEFGIALCALAILFGMPAIDRLYAGLAGTGFRGLAVRAVVAAVCLIPPTVLMGASLPAIARWHDASPDRLSLLGFFYGANIAGAVVGCVAAGFWLLRLYDTTVATFFAACINVAAALVSFSLARSAANATVESPRNSNLRVSRTIYGAIAVSGFCALGAEVIWTRQLSLIIGGTVYTFSIILAVFLCGLGIGSSGAAYLTRDMRNPRRALALCQAMLAGAIAWSAWMLSASLPYWPIEPTLSTDPWFSFQLDAVRCLWAILPATVLWGFSFPLALAASADPGVDTSRLVGRMYAMNTAGAIAGAVGCSMILIPSIGTQGSQRLLIVLAAGAAAMLSLRMTPIGVTVALLALVVPPVPWELIAYGRQLPSRAAGGHLVLSAEGVNASIAVTRLEKVRLFHISGKTEASSQGHDMRLQRMLGHLPALFHGSPKSVLVVGFGAGVTAGSFLPHPALEKLVICEIEPLIPRLIAPVFAAENYNVIGDARTRVVYDDGRHFVLTTGESFDIITSDPIHPWVRGNAALYTKEYFEACKRKLRRGGIVTQWVPLYESDVATVKSELATFFDVFPNATVWSNDDEGVGYDVVLLGSREDVRFDDAELQRRFDHPPVAASLRQVGFANRADLLATYAAQATDLSQWLRGAEINRDRTLHLHYLAGMGMNARKADFIYREILKYRRPLRAR
jgi:spermidine synthase